VTKQTFKMLNTRRLGITSTTYLNKAKKKKLIKINMPSKENELTTTPVTVGSNILLGNSLFL